MIYTELRFASVLEKIDELVEEISDIGGEENSIFDDNHHSDIVMWENGELTDEAVTLLAELDARAGDICYELDDIQKDMELSHPEFELMKDSCTVNRWELYARFKNAEIVTPTKLQRMA